MNESIKKFDSFISYVNEDFRLVERIYKELTSSGYGEPSLDIWRDEDRINYGDNIITKINFGLLKESNSAILLITPNYLNCRREWIKMEAELAYEQSLNDENFKIFIIPYDISNKELISNKKFKFLSNIRSNLDSRDNKDLPNTIFKIKKSLHDSKNNQKNYSKGNIEIEKDAIKMETLKHYIDGIKARIINLFQSHGIDLFNMGSFIGQENFKISSLFDSKEFIDNIDYNLLRTLAETFRVTYEWLSFKSDFCYTFGLEVRWYKNIHNIGRKLFKYNYKDNLHTEVMFIRRMSADFEQAKLDNDRGKWREEPIGVIIKFRNKTIEGVEYYTYEVLEIERWNYHKCRSELKELICFCEAARIPFWGYELSDDSIKQFREATRLPVDIITKERHNIWYPDDYASNQFEVKKEVDEWEYIKEDCRKMKEFANDLIEGKLPVI